MRLGNVMSKSYSNSLFGFFLLGLFSTFGSAVSPVLPQYAEQLGASYIEIGLFFSAYSLTWAVLQLYTGYLSDKYGRKKFAALGLLVYGTFLTLGGLSQDFVQLIIFRVIQGVGLGLFGPACLGLVAQEEERGKSFAVYRTANGLGFTIGPVVGGILGSENLRYPFFIGGLLSLSAILSLFIISEDEGYEGVHARETFFNSLKGMILTKRMALICLAAFTAELTFASLEIIIPLFGSSQGISPAGVGIILSSYFITFILFQIPIGMLSEKVNRKFLIVISSLVGALPFLLLSYSHDVITMSLATGALGVTLGTVFIQSSAYVAEIAPKDKRSLYMAFFDSVMDYSFIIMPPIMAYAFIYSLIAPFFLCALLMTVAGLIFMKA